MVGDEQEEAAEDAETEAADAEEPAATEHQVPSTGSPKVRHQAYLATSDTVQHKAH